MRRNLCVGAASLLIATIAAPAFGATSVFWKSATSGVWSVASNWLPGVVPSGAFYDVTVNPAGAAYEVGYMGDAGGDAITIHSLVVASPDAEMRIGTTLIASLVDVQSGKLSLSAG